MSPRLPAWDREPFGRAALRLTLYWLFLSLAYGISRAWALERFPLFVDEGVYLWYAESVLRLDLVRGFGEGKPLVGWLIAIPLSAEVDSLYSARLPLVAAGYLGLVTTWLVARRLAGTRAAAIAGTLYVLSPYLFFFQRIATPDIVVAALGMTSVWLALRAYDRDSIAYGAAAAIVLILTVLAKSPVGAYFYLPPALLPVFLGAKTRLRTRRFLVSVYLLPSLFLLAAAGLVYFRWSRGLAPVGFGMHEVLAKTDSSAGIPAQLRANLSTLARWIGTFSSWPVAVFLAGGLIASWRGDRPGVRMLALLAIIWTLGMAAISSFWPPRYLAPVVPLALIVAAWALDAFARRLARYAPAGRRSLASNAVIATCLVIAALPALRSQAAFVSNPPTSPMSAGYLTGLASGYGYEEAASYLQQLGGEMGQFQAVALHVGNYTRLKAYTERSLWPRLRQVHVVDGRSRSPDEQITLLRSWLTDAEITYVILEKPGQALQDAFPDAVLVQEFVRPGGVDSLQMWRVD